MPKKKMEPKSSVPLQANLTLKDIRDENHKLVTQPDGGVNQTVIEKIIPGFKIRYIFGIDQTEGNTLPEPNCKLEGNLSNRQKQLKDVLLDIRSVLGHFQLVSGNANGYYDFI